MLSNENIMLSEDAYEALHASSFTAATGRGTGGRGHAGRAAKSGRHRKPQPLGRMRSEHGRRLISFSLIGFGVFAAGLAAQIFLVQIAGLPKIEAYILQLGLSVQANFLANYRWTWGDRDAPFWRSCWRYNVKRLAGVLLNLVLYPVLIHFGMNYLAANVLLVIMLTPANYILGHFWTFASDSPPRGAGMRENTAQPY